MALHTLLNYSRFSPGRFLKSSTRSCSPLKPKSWVGVYPEGEKCIAEALAGVIVSRTLHKFVMSKVGLSSVWSLLSPLIEIMACAYPPFRISNLWSVADILTFPDCRIVIKYLSCPCNSNLIFRLPGNLCTLFWPVDKWYRG